MKYCNDCKHFAPASFLDRLVLSKSYWRCAVSPSRDGYIQPTRKGQFADLSREFGPCGKDAKLFEAKK